MDREIDLNLSPLDLCHTTHILSCKTKLANMHVGVPSARLCRKISINCLYLLQVSMLCTLVVYSLLGGFLFPTFYRRRMCVLGNAEGAYNASVGSTWEKKNIKYCGLKKVFFLKQLIAACSEKVCMPRTHSCNNY